MRAPGVPSAWMQCEHCHHHATHPSEILLLFRSVFQGAVPGDKHQLPGPQSASNGRCSIVNVARAIKDNETQSETAVDDHKVNKFAPASLQVLSWPSGLTDIPQSLLSELEPLRSMQHKTLTLYRTVALNKQHNPTRALTCKVRRRVV